MKKFRMTALLMAFVFLLTACGGNKAEKEQESDGVFGKSHIFREEELDLGAGMGNPNQLKLVGDTLYVETVQYSSMPDTTEAEAVEAEGEEAETGEEVSAEEAETTKENTEEEGTETVEIDVEEAAEIAEIDVEEAAETAGIDVEEEAETTAEAEVGEKVSTEAIESGAEETAAAEEVEEAIMETEFVAQEGYTRVITAFDLEGNKLSELKIKLPANCGMGYLTMDSQGNIYSTYNYYGMNQDGSEDSRVYLQGHSAQGKELFTLWLNEEQDSNEYFYVNSLYCLEEGTLVVETGTGVLLYDTLGNPVGQAEKGGMEGENRLMKVRDDQFVLIGMEGDKSFYQTFDIKTGQKGEKIELPFILYVYTILEGKDYDFYLSDAKGIYGYNLGDAEPTPIMGFLASDFSSYGMNQISFIDGDSFIASYFTDEGTGVGRFIRIPEDEVVEKAELILGCSYLDSEIKKQVIKFNKQSTAYRITIRDYSEYNTEEDYTVGQSRLNSDIASGNVPDIILLHSGMPLESYMAKGVFADYYELMEADADFHREDYLPNVFAAYETKGKLYQMIPFFYINTFVGKTADVGEDFTWTMEEALALQASRPEGTVLFPNVIRDSFMQICLVMNYEEYINWETGECFFDTEKFIRMLEYAKTLPKEYTHVDYNDQQAYLEMEMQYREGRSLLSQNMLSTFRDYGSLRYATFGEDITLVGFPTEVGIGSAFSTQCNLAISEYSEHKQAAWEFVKSMLSEEYQDNLEYCFPVRLSSLEKMEEEARQKPHYLDENGNKVEYELTYYVGNMEIPGSPLTKKETGVVMEFIKSIERTGSYNQEIYNIITEETAPFFEGQKSAKEAADIIQSRVRIYVNENR
ncbi:MAG: extracellular solute-binding protein [Lachnospiraceae bacterium]|nr:extracellular solute-binding protein [Lachnospiraceae bacterium]